MQSRTVGKRLLSAFSVTFVLILSLLGLYVQQSRQSNQQLDQVLHTFNKKLDVANSIELATTEMQGAQRGLMLSYEAKDDSTAPQYIQLYQNSSRKIDANLAAFEPLVASAAERSALTNVQENLTTWKPRFEELVTLCVSGDLAKAYALRSQNKLISAAMHAAAKAIVDQQEHSLAAAEAASAVSVARSLWLTVLAIVVSLVLGMLVYLQVDQITASLRQMVLQLDEGASQLAEGANHISAASQTLAAGTSEQAFSIGETTAASEQIGAMTRRNAENATKASGLMQDTTTLVGDANRSLGQMQESMQAINESSTKVGDIIKIIDQIAFQTNILALNAAVEAARAGEAGMGFAVVADEVRNLAHRSAQAAKDTTKLIEESVARSHEGGSKLELVATSIRAITSSSTQVKGLVDEVKSGSLEQTKGIQLISTQMNTIEKITQSAAASAEEGAATGEQMQAQANSLHGIVRHLREMVG
ncbi:MAG TPA: methyl-accepting chemotaxis protein [Granulicella sp.]|nr:methyl-accepting chemotaxis protein [Granulicella sp.]